MSRRPLLPGGLPGVLLMAVAALPVVVGLGGCEIYDFARNPTITFALPARMFAITTEDPRWKAPPATFSQRIDCTTAADCCTLPPGSPPEVPPPDCSQIPLVCDGGQCATTFSFEIPQTIDLAKQVPSLGSMGGKVVSEITLQSLTYTIKNQLGIALPPVAVHVAPAQVASAMGSPDAKPLATLPTTPAGATAMDTISLTPDAKQAFGRFAKDFRTPFNFIGSTTMTLRSGSPPPMGRVDVTVTGTVTASF